MHAVMVAWVGYALGGVVVVQIEIIARRPDYVGKSAAYLSAE